MEVGKRRDRVCGLMGGCGEYQWYRLSGMGSIVIELRRDALSPDVDVSTLLRKALVIATKLGIPDFKFGSRMNCGGIVTGTMFHSIESLEGT